MKLTKISRSKSFEMVNGYGLKSWQKFSIEGDLAEQENPLEAYTELGKIIDQAFKEANPTVVITNKPKEIQVDKKMTLLFSVWGKNERESKDRAEALVYLLEK